jgi:hypothetical protein
MNGDFARSKPAMSAHASTAGPRRPCHIESNNRGNPNKLPAYNFRETMRKCSAKNPGILRVRHNVSNGSISTSQRRGRKPPGRGR